MRVFIVFAVCVLWLNPTTLFAQFEFQQKFLTRQAFEKLVNVKEAKKSTGSYRVLHQLDFQLDAHTVTKHVTSIWYFATPSDVQKLGQGTISFNEKTQKVKLINAATVLPDGSIYHLAVDDTKQMDSNTYDVFSSWQKMLFSFSKLEAGGFTFLEYEVTTNKRKMESDWSTTHFPQIYYKTGKYKFSAEWKKSTEPNIKINSDYVSCAKRLENIVCNGSQIPAAILDNNIYSYDVLGHIELGDLNSWEEVSSLSMKKFESAYSKSPEYLKNFLVAELGENFTIPEALDFIHQYVARNIRYLSKSEHGNSVTPHKTQTTLEKKMGDCKDKTALFIDLARQAGINSYPVLVSTVREKLKEDLVPSLNKFNHVIACYKYNAKEYCSDLTDAETDWKNIASWVQGKFSLRVLPNSVPKLLMADEYRWRYNVLTEVQLKTNGGQEEKQTRAYENLYSAFYRREANGKKQEELQRWLVDDYHNVVSKEASPTITIKGLESINSKVVIQSNTSFAPFLDTNEKFSYSEKDSWLVQGIRNNYPSNEFYGEYIAGTHVESRYIYDLPDLWHITVKPADVRLEHHFGLLLRTSSIETSGKLVVETTLKLPSTYVKKEELETYRKFLDSLNQELTIHIRITP